MTGTDDAAVRMDGGAAGVFRSLWTRFRAWRQLRPFWGGLLLTIGGLIIGYVPLQFGRQLLVTGGSFASIGLVFAALVFFCGICALIFPRLSSLLGLLGMVLSTLSLFGALGGLLVGMVVGGIGGLLCFAWEPPEDLWRERVAESSRFIWEREDWDTTRFSWEEETDDKELVLVAPLALTTTLAVHGGDSVVAVAVTLV
jgi:hypothetical protein